MTLGNRLKTFRTSAGYTQDELGEMLNVTKANISKYENDKIEPNLATLSKLADIFDTSIDYLIDGVQKVSSSDKNPLKNQLDEILEKNGIVKPGEDLTDEQLDWLMKLVDKAIEMTKLDD